VADAIATPVRDTSLSRASLCSMNLDPHRSSQLLQHQQQECALPYLGDGQLGGNAGTEKGKGESGYTEILAGYWDYASVAL
jgi:hypothetical protein